MCSAAGNRRYMYVVHNRWCVLQLTIGGVCCKIRDICSCSTAGNKGMCCVIGGVCCEKGVCVPLPAIRCMRCIIGGV